MQNSITQQASRFNALSAISFICLYKVVCREKKERDCGEGGERGAAKAAGE